MGRTFVSQRYGPRWRDGRKAFQRGLNIQTVRKFRPAKLELVNELLYHLHDTPKEFMTHIRRYRIYHSLRSE